MLDTVYELFWLISKGHIFSLRVVIPAVHCSLWQKSQFDVCLSITTTVANFGCLRYGCFHVIETGRILFFFHERTQEQLLT